MFGIKKAEYRKFHMQPRYWNPEKEAREERIKRAKAELGLEDENTTYIPDLKGKFTREYNKRKAEKIGYSSKYTVRLFMILVMLFLGAYLILLRNPDTLLWFFGK